MGLATVCCEVKFSSQGFFVKKGVAVSSDKDEDENKRPPFLFSLSFALFSAVFSILAIDRLPPAEIGFEGGVEMIETFSSSVATLLWISSSLTKD